MLRDTPRSALEVVDLRKCYADHLALDVAIVLSGVPVYWVWQRRRTKP